MDNKFVSKNIWISGSVLLLMGTMVACNLTSSEPTELPIQQIESTAISLVQPVDESLNQETNALPVPLTRVQPTLTVDTPVQPTLTVDTPVQHAISPEELAPSLYYEARGGGGEPEGCGDSIPSTFFETYNGSEGGGFSQRGDEITFGERLIVYGCDFPNAEEITVIFYLPNGDSETLYTQVDSMSGWWNVNWFSIPVEPTGRYEVEMVSNSGTFTGDFTVSEPVKPTMMVLCFEDEEEGMVWLTGFQASEEVLIARYVLDYSSNMNLIDYVYITVEHDGVAFFTIPNEATRVIAIGQETPVSILSNDFETEMPMSAIDDCDPRMIE